MKTRKTSKDEKNIQVLRVVALLAAFLYLSFGIVIEQVVGLDDPIPGAHRVLFALAFGGLALLSYKLPPIRDRFRILFYTIALGAVIHLLWMGTQTRFDAGSIVAMLLAVPFLNFLFSRWKFLLILNALLFFIIAGAFLLSEPSFVDALLFLIFSSAIIGVSFWLTHRVRAIETAAAKNEQMFTDLFHYSMEGIAIHELTEDNNGKPTDYVFLDVNPAFEQHTGLKSSEILGKKVSEVLPGIQQTPFIAAYGRVVHTAAPVLFEQFSDPLQRYYRIRAYPMNDKRFATVFEDITEARTKEQERARITAEYETVFHSTRDALFLVEVVDLQTFRYRRTNRAHMQATGLASDQMKGTTPQELVGETMGAAICANYRRCVLQRQTISYEETLALPGGTRTWSTVLTPVVEGETVCYLVGCSRDITEEKRALETIEYLSFHDELTGLKNRRFFERELQRIDDPDHFPLAIIMVDVNGLKLINDAFGHAAGDKMLTTAAEALKNVCRAEDIVARIGGDEFAVILPRVAEDTLHELTEQICEVANHKTVAGLPVSIACGWALKTDAQEKVQNVFKVAEDRMYSEKVSDRNSHRHNTIKLIMQTLYAKSLRERQHSQRVSRLCGKIAAAMGFSRREIDEMIIAGELHDIGKIAIDNELLDRDTPLTDADWDQMKRHPQVGHSILSAVDDYGSFAQGVLAHHERWDGTGYPRGLQGSAIPLTARIIAIADTYDVMTRGRPYRSRVSQREALDEIRQCAGRQFDPEIVAVFLSVMDAASQNG